MMMRKSNNLKITQKRNIVNPGTCSCEQNCCMLNKDFSWLFVAKMLIYSSVSIMCEVLLHFLVFGSGKGKKQHLDTSRIEYTLHQNYYLYTLSTV